MQIDSNAEKGRSALLNDIGWRKNNKGNILNKIVEIIKFRIFLKGSLHPSNVS